MDEISLGSGCGGSLDRKKLGEMAGEEPGAAWEESGIVATPRGLPGTPQAPRCYTQACGASIVLSGREGQHASPPKWYHDNCSSGEVSTAAMLCGVPGWKTGLWQ